MLRTFDPMEDITAISTKLGTYPVHKGIRYVIIQTGDIDSQSLTPMTQNSVSLLIGTIKLKFPQSQTTISACLFPKGSRQSSKIDKFNQMLQETCAFNSTRYINLSDRFQDETLLNQDLTFSDAGIRQLAKSYSYALKPDVRAKQTASQPQSEAAPTVNNQQAPSHSQEAKPQNQRGNRLSNDNKKDDQLNYVATNVAWGPLHNGFQAFGARAKSRLEATVFKACLLDDDRAVSCATHNMLAARIIENGELIEYGEDDRERGAGNHILKVMREMNMINCVVVVSRWYAGHIQHRRWNIVEELTSEVGLKMGFSKPPPRQHRQGYRQPPRYSSGQRRVSGGQRSSSTGNGQYRNFRNPPPSYGRFHFSPTHHPPLHRYSSLPRSPPHYNY